MCSSFLDLSLSSSRLVILCSLLFIFAGYIYNIQISPFVSTWLTHGVRLHRRPSGVLSLVSNHFSLGWALPINKVTYTMWTCGLKVFRLWRGRRRINGVLYQAPPRRRVLWKTPLCVVKNIRLSISLSQNINLNQNNFW